MLRHAPQHAQVLTFVEPTDAGRSHLAAAVVDMADRLGHMGFAGSLGRTSDCLVHIAEHRLLVAVAHTVLEADQLADTQSAVVAVRPFGATSWVGSAPVGLAAALDLGRS